MTCRLSWAVVGPVMEIVEWPFRPDHFGNITGVAPFCLTEVGLDLRQRRRSQPAFIMIMIMKLVSVT